MFWGYGPAVDILSEIKDLKPLDSREEINVLLIGASDSRHILQTVAKYYTHPKKRVNFYVTEVMLDMVARQMLLLLTALEPPDRLGLLEKTRLWMELYGNTLVRPNTVRYLVKKAHQLVHMVTDEAYLAFRLPAVSMSMLKYKERDSLETIFQFWARGRFDHVTKLWDARLRQSLGARYDSKEGMFDWDYYMRLKEVPEGARIHPREYKQWRATGVAFTWLESEVSEPNPTLASGIVKLGDRLLNHGYLGDIVSPPYLGFGTDSEDKEMLASRNGTNLHRSTDIVEANLKRLFHEIETQEVYKPQGGEEAGAGAALGAVITEVTTSRDEEAEIEPQEPDVTEDFRRRENYSSLSMGDTRVLFLPTTALVDLPRKPSLRGHFDVVMVSQNLTQRLSADVMDLARNGALLLAETRKFITSSSDKEKNDFAEHLVKLAKERECVPLQPVDGVRDYLAKFRVNRKHGYTRVNSV